MAVKPSALILSAVAGGRLQVQIRHHDTRAFLRQRGSQWRPQAATCAQYQRGSCP